MFFSLTPSPSLSLTIVHAHDVSACSNTSVHVLTIKEFKVAAKNVLAATAECEH